MKIINYVKTFVFLIVVLSLLFPVTVICSATAQEKEVSQQKYKNVLVIPIEGEIEKALPFFVRRGLLKAEKNAAAVVVKIDTPGGELWQAQYIRDALVEYNLDTYAYIKHAISAGALVSLATDYMYMQDGSQIGGAQPWVPGGGGNIPEGKLISVTKKAFVSTAKLKGHDPEIAEAFVDPDYKYPKYKKKGEPLTLDSYQATELNFVEGTAINFEDFLEKAGLGGANIIEHRLTGAEKFARFISQMHIASLLLMLGIIGIVMEMKAPGFGFPGILGMICLVLFFWGNYIALLANSLEIILFFIGVILILLEIFVVPGFGIAGIGGGVCMLASIFLATFRMPPEGISFELWRLEGPLRVMFISAIMGVTGGILAIWGLKKSPLWKQIELSTDLSSKDGFISSPDLSDMIGAEGVAFTDLRPSGVVKIGEDRFDAVTRGNYIFEGSKVIVIGIQTYSLLVKIIEESKTEKQE